MKRTAKYLLLITLTLVVSTAALGQGGEVSDEPPLIVPDYPIEQAVNRILKWSFKPRKHPTVIFLSSEGIAGSWLPSIKNIEFRLIPIDIAQKSPEGVYSFDPKGIYFFTPLKLEGEIYSVGFGRGDPKCHARGDTWSFRISGEKIRLWLSGGFRSGCYGGHRHN